MANSMPLRGSKEAPRFSSDKPRDIDMYIDEFEELATSKDLGNDDKFKYFLRYADSDARDHWEQCKNYKVDWQLFKDEVKKLYLGDTEQQRYTIGDLEKVYEEHRDLRSISDLVAFHREATKILGHLLKQKKISTIEQNRLYLEGIQGSLRKDVIFRLSILKPNIHKGGPYEIADVYASAQFVLQGRTATSSTTSLATSSLRVASGSVSTNVKTEPQDPLLAELRAMRRDMAALIQRPQDSSNSGQNRNYNPSSRSTNVYCSYCRQTDHYRRNCADLQQDIAAGLVKIGDNGRLYLPNNNDIPTNGQQTLKDAVRATASKNQKDPPPHMNAGLYNSGGAGAAYYYGSMGTYSPLSYGHAPVLAYPSGSSTTSSPTTVKIPAATIEDVDSDEEEEALAIREIDAAKAKLDGIHAKKKVRFDGIELPSGPAARRPPATNTATSSDERPATKSQQPTAKSSPPSAPTVVYPQSTGRNDAASRPQGGNDDPRRGQYRYTTTIETENPQAGAKVYETILNARVSLDIRDLLSISGDLRKMLKESVTTKRISQSNNELAHTALWEQPHLMARDGSGGFNPEIFYQGNPLYPTIGILGAFMDWSTRPLRAVPVTLNGVGPLEGVLDSGASFIAVHKKVWDVMHETGCRTDLTIPLITADSTPHRTYGLLPNITFSIGSFKVTVQAHVVHEGPFDVLIGQPFRAITRMHSQVDFDGSKIIELRDPVNNTKFAISTHLHDMRNNKFAKGHERDFRPPQPPKTPPIQHAPQGDDHVHDHDHDHDHDHGHPVDFQQSTN